MMHITDKITFFITLEISWETFYWRDDKAYELLDIQNRARLNSDKNPDDLTQPITSKNLSQTSLNPTQKKMQKL